MEDIINPAKDRMLGLLKFLSDKKSACQVEKSMLGIIAGHIAFGPTGSITEVHQQLLSELEIDGVLTASADSCTIEEGKIPEGTVSMSDDDVLELLLKSIGISGLIKIDANRGPNKDILPVMWELLLSFAERHRTQSRPST
jgi:hypothetical protein